MEKVCVPGEPLPVVVTINQHATSCAVILSNGPGSAQPSWSHRGRLACWSLGENENFFILEKMEEGRKKKKKRLRKLSQRKEA
eukprot:scaffold131648_cov15-Tisochrysis_lutea.AAC.1